jgi:hypothetical protein
MSAHSTSSNLIHHSSLAVCTVFMSGSTNLDLTIPQQKKKNEEEEENDEEEEKENSDVKV